EGTMQIWDVETGQERRRFYGGVAAAFSADGRELITVTHDGGIHRFDAVTAKRIEHETQARSDFIHAEQVVFAANGRMIAVSDGYNNWLKETATGKTLLRLDFPRWVLPVAFSPDGGRLAMRDEDGLRFIDTATGRERGWLRQAHVGACSPNGRQFAWSDDQ